MRSTFPHTQINKQQQSIDYNLLHLSLLLPANIDFIFHYSCLPHPPGRGRWVKKGHSQKYETEIWISPSLSYILSAFISPIYSYFSLPSAFLSNPRLVTIRLCICVRTWGARQPSELSRIDSRADILFRRCISQDARHQKSWGDAFMSMERVCVCVTGRDQGSRSCLFVFGQRKKHTQCDWEKQWMVKKRACTMVLRDTVSIAKMWTCTIMCNHFSILAFNVCGCIPICSIQDEN